MKRGTVIVALLLAGSAGAQTPLDLARLVEERCGPTGYQKQAGCIVRLGRGEFEIDATRLGTCESTSTQRLGLTLEGQGGGVFATQPSYATGGTTLRYAGPPGGTMLSLCGSRIHLRDLAIDGTGAARVVEFRANNPASAITHLGGLERIDIRGGGVGIEVFGETRNDQLDFLSFRDLSIRDVDGCFEQDSQQAVANKLDNVECASYRFGYRVRSGSVHFDRAYVGQLAPPGEPVDPDYVGFHLTRTSDPDQPSISRQVVSIRDSHMEIRAGRWVVDDSNSIYGVLLEGNLFQMLVRGAGSAPETERVIIDSLSRGPLRLFGNTVTADLATPLQARVCRRGPGATQQGVDATPHTGGIVWGCP